MRMFSSKETLGNSLFPALMTNQSAQDSMQIKFIVKWTFDFKPKMTAVRLYLSDFLSDWCVQAGCEGTFNRSTIYVAPLTQGAPWQYMLGCEHDCCYYRLMQECNPFGQPTRQIVILTLTAFKVLVFGCWKLRKFGMMLHDLHDFTKVVAAFNYRKYVVKYVRLQ